MPENEIEAPSNLTPGQDNVFDSEDSQNSLEHASYGDLYVLGKLWVDLLKLGLLGTVPSVAIPKMPSIIPVVNAAPEVKIPERPPKMKYKDLPLYPTSPHHLYKDYMEDKQKCPEAKTRLLHKCVLPHVKRYRECIQENYTDFMTESRSMKKELCGAINKKKNKFKSYMRDPNNLNMRRAVVVIGGATGYYLGSGKGIPRRIFFTSAGLLAAGALCFPKETDETFRNFTYTTAKFVISVYNNFCGKAFGLRERLPCKTDLPPPGPPLKPNVCPKPKK